MIDLPLSDNPFTFLDGPHAGGIIGGVFGIRAYRQLVEQVTEVQLRLDGTLAGLDRTLERNAQVIAENSRIHHLVIEAIEDMRDQIRANTDATLRLLDRLGGNENPA